MGTSLGGMGLSLLELARVGEILGQTPIGHYVFGCQAPDAGNMEVLHQFGTEEQKQNYLHPLVRGDIRSCFSMTEPDFAGSNPIHMATTAIRDGGEYVINGHKWFTTGADSAAFAIVMVVTNPENGKYNQASQIIVPTDTKDLKSFETFLLWGKKVQDGIPTQKFATMMFACLSIISLAKKEKVLPLPNKDSDLVVFIIA